MPCSVWPGVGLRGCSSGGPGPGLADGRTAGLAAESAAPGGTRVWPACSSQAARAAARAAGRGAGHVQAGTAPSRAADRRRRGMGLSPIPDSGGGLGCHFRVEVQVRKAACLTPLVIQQVNKNRFQEVSAPVPPVVI